MERDSGNPNQVFAVNQEGKVLAAYTLNGSTNHDWEDLDVGPGPEPGKSYIYVWENRCNEADGMIYRVEEPTVSEDPSNPPAPNAVPTYTINKVDAFKIRMLDANGNGRAFGCEAMMIDPTTGDLFLVEKAYSGTTCALAWRGNFTSLTDDAPIYTVQEIKRYPILEITAADISATGRFIALNRHQTVNIWTREPGQTVKDVLLNQPISPITVTCPNFGEAMAFSAEEDGFYATPEGVPNVCGTQDGRLWFYPKTEVPINPP